MSRYNYSKCKSDYKGLFFNERFSFYIAVSEKETVVKVHAIT